MDAVRLALLLLPMLAAPALAQGCPALGWDRFLGPGEQKFKQVERIPVGAGKMVLALRFEGLDGKYPKRFLFLRYSGRDCVDAAVSLGSFAFVAAETGRAPGEFWHLDHYTLGEKETLETFSAEQPYAVVKQAAMDLLAH